MDHNTLLKQVFNLHRNTFDSLYNGIVTLQDQAEKTAGLILDSAPWMTEEGKNVINEWRKQYKKGREDFKRAVEDGYDKLETYLAPLAEAGKKGAEKSK